MGRDAVILSGAEELAALSDLADARGLPVEELVREAVRRYVDEEAGRVRDEAGRLARRHEELLRRLGQ
ncbi:ribbon-helix-helix protein, CopG family [Streptomyces sp. NPDC053493]|uniref:ribbon-helix-helix protein, CopG family n=1 Tax=Streptomyces sp. NPDC053493 TaxID=3365705 RepID=UPI0037D71A77